SRLLAGRFDDPLIGRDVLVGVACAAFLSLLNLGADALPPRWGMPERIPHQIDLGLLMGFKPLMVAVLGSVNTGLQNALITVFEFAILRVVLEWIARTGLQGIGRRWAWASRLTLSDRASQRFSVVLAFVILIINDTFGIGAPSSGRLFDIVL